MGDGSAVAVDRSGLRVGAGAGIVGAALANSTLASIVASAARSPFSSQHHGSPSTPALFRSPDCHRRPRNPLLVESGTNSSSRVSVGAPID